MNIYATFLRSIFRNLIGLFLIVTFLAPTISFPQYNNPTAVNLSTAGTYGALANTGITGTANVNGDVGTINSTVAASISPSGTNWNEVNPAHNDAAQTDLATALSEVNGRTNDNNSLASALGGQTLNRGIYGGSDLDLASGTTLTLNGSSTDIFIIKSATSLVININSSVLLTGGAVWSNVYWYVTTAATIFSGATFNGIIMAVGQITLNDGATQVTSKFLSNTGSISIQSNVLPVELTSFSATLNKSSVSLNWNTSTEVNNFGFNVERSVKSGEWTKIGFMNGHGNSNSPKDYSFIDNTITYAGEYFYRLKQIDFDGKFEYSDIVEINVKAPTSFSVKQNFPNPFNPITNIEYSIPNTGRVTLKIYNLLGSEIATLVNEEKQPGNYQVKFNGSKLSSGIYFYTINAPGFLQSKKMILMK